VDGERGRAAATFGSPAVRSAATASQRTSTWPERR
jgi:hypothetical protein